MSRVYEALKNARDQRMKRGPLEAEATPQESGVGEPVHNGKAASRIPEILSTVRSEGAPPARPLELEELQQRCAKPEWKPQPRWNVFPKEGPCGRQASAEEIKPPDSDSPGAVPRDGATQSAAELASPSAGAPPIDSPGVVLNDGAIQSASELASPPAGAPPIDSPGAVLNDGATQSTSELASPPAGTPPIFPCLRLEELRQRCAKPPWKFDPDGDAFLNKPSLALCAEQFRTLRARLYQCRGMKPIRTLMVTSTVAGEGKTFVALNLAQAIVRQKERQALLIDADLRASRLPLAMGAPFMPGLADYLRGEADEFSIVQTNTKDNLF